MQVVWLKVELCRLLEEKRSATLRFVLSLCTKFPHLSRSGWQLSHVSFTWALFGLREFNGILFFKGWNLWTETMSNLLHTFGLVDLKIELDGWKS